MPNVRLDGFYRRTRSWRWNIIVAILCCGAVVTGVLLWRRSGADPAHAAISAQKPAVPVTTAEAALRDVPVYLDSLGTVQASNTVAIRSQVDGKIQSINFIEGQAVAKGDVIAQIDPRPFQATLDQAKAKKAQDEAQLVSAQKDLDRFKTLALKGFDTQQNLDQQQAKVDQFKAAIDADQAAIESADTQLSYTGIVAPIGGRVGFRQIDVGNIIHANDANPLTVLTQVRPSVVLYTLPQKNLYDVREAMRKGPVSVTAFDQDKTRQLATGELLLIDNQIDQTTSTIRLKATFPNEDDALWPGEFVDLHTLIDVRKNAVTIPTVAVQRGPQGYFAWVKRPDNTVEQRTIEIGVADAGATVVNTGIAAGDRVVVRGQYRLQAGTRVEERPAAADNPERSS